MEHTGPRPWMVAVTGRACKEAAGGVSGAGEAAKIPWGTGRCCGEPGRFPGKPGRCSGESLAYKPVTTCRPGPCLEARQEETTRAKLAEGSGAGVAGSAEGSDGGRAEHGAGGSAGGVDTVMDITGWRSAEAGDGRSPHRGGEDENGSVGGGVTAVDGQRPRGAEGAAARPVRHDGHHRLVDWRYCRGHRRWSRARHCGHGRQRGEHEGGHRQR